MKMDMAPTEEEIDVLIVDDDEAIRALLRVAMSRMELSCHMAVDGADALAKIATTSYAVILLDLMMPRMDGGEVVARMRELETPSGSRPTVLMMTALPSSARLPVSDGRVQVVVRKPFEMAALSVLVSDCVKSMRRRRFIDGAERGGRSRARETEAGIQESS